MSQNDVPFLAPKKLPLPVVLFWDGFVHHIYESYDVTRVTV